jgi:hypothetical protein
VKHALYGILFVCAKRCVSIYYTQHERVEIMRARAAASIQQGRLHLAAIYYAQSGLSFDEVALSLLHCLPESATAVNTTTSSANAGTTVVAGSSGKGSAPVTALAASVGASAEASAAHPLSPLVESNLAYFGENVSTTTPTKTGAPAASPAANNTSGAYNRVAYTSPSLVDTAISKGCALTPLKVFLLQVLRSLPSGAKMQRTMLCTWLCDLYLHQINLARLVGKQTGQGATTSAAAAAGECCGSDHGVFFLSTTKYVFSRPGAMNYVPCTGIDCCNSVVSLTAVKCPLFARAVAFHASPYSAAVQRAHLSTPTIVF